MSGRALVLWDIEALHDAVMELEYGGNWFRRFKADGQPPVIDIQSVLDALRQQVGENVHDALADWRYFDNYAAAMERFAFRPIQLFPHGRSTSTAWRDYKRVLFERQLRGGSIDSLVVVGVNARLEPILDQAKSSGYNLIGVGLPLITEERHVAVCDIYIDYTELHTSSSGETPGRPSKEDDDHLVHAMLRLSRKTGMDWIKRVRVKPELVRLNPNFDEKSFGYANFSEYLNDQTSILECRQPGNHREPEYRLLEQHREAVVGRLSEEDQRLQDTIAMYLRISSQQGLRLPEPEVMWIGIDIYASLLRDPDGFRDFKELDDECLLQLRKDIPTTTMTDAKKIRQVLFKCFLFSPGENDRIGFRQDIKSLEEVENLYFDLILTRVAGNAPQPIDFEALSVAATGENGEAGRLESYYRRQLANPASS